MDAFGGIMTGMLMNLWAAPVMTPCRLVMTLFLTGYIVMSVTRLEEPSLRAEMGAAYDEYLKKTPRFFPTAPSYYAVKVSVQTPGLKDD